MLQPDFHGCSSISLAFARWIPGPPWFPVEPDLPHVTPSYNRMPPSDTSECRLKTIFAVSEMLNLLPGSLPIIITAETNKKILIRHMQPQRRMEFKELPVVASLRVRMCRSTKICHNLCCICEQIDSRSSRCKTQDATCEICIGIQLRMSGPLLYRSTLYIIEPICKLRRRSPCLSVY